MQDPPALAAATGKNAYSWLLTLRTFLREHRAIVLAYVLIMCVVTVERVAIPHFYGRILDHLKSEQFGSAARIFGVLIAFFVGFQLLDILLTWLDAQLLPPLEGHVREELMRTIVQRHSEHYRELDLGNVTSKLIKLPANLRAFFYQTKAFLFNHVLTVLITGGYLVWCHWTMGAIYVASFAALGIVAWRFSRQCIPKSYARESSFDETQETMQDILLNLLSVYNGQTEKKEEETVRRANGATIQHTRAHILCGIPYRAWIAGIFIVSLSAITGMGFHLYRQKSITLASMVSSFIVTFSVIKIAGRLYYDCDTFAYLYGSIKVVLDFIQQLPSPPATSPPTATTVSRAVAPGRQGVHVQLDNVSFAYPRATDAAHHTVLPRNVLRNVTLTLPPRSRVALMGSIGSGKSSLAQLLLRLQTHTHGTIRWNGADIRQVPVHELRSRTVYVPQHPRLFNRTLWDNISYGNPSVQPADVDRLLLSLGMDDVARVFRNKMHERVGKQGSRLSGGQRQIVWLLRALLHPAVDLVVLDEPTSALDKRSSQQVQRAIQQLAQRCTLVLVTHDEQLLSLVNRVIRMENGVVVDDRRV